MTRAHLFMGKMSRAALVGLLGGIGLAGATANAQAVAAPAPVRATAPVPAAPRYYYYYANPAQAQPTARTTIVRPYRPRYHSYVSVKPVPLVAKPWLRPLQP